MNIYETDRLLAEYLLFHYGSAEEILSPGMELRAGLEFPRRCAQWVLRHQAPGSKRALDLGCAVGRASFELSGGFEEVLGIDFSASFIRAAERLKHEGQLAYERVDEGRIRTVLQAQVPAGLEPGRVSFEQGDACHLREDLGEFDAILMANLLCRLPDPQACLERSRSLLRRGGVMVLTTPCSWMEEFTLPEKWLGGRQAEEGAGEVRTLEGIREVLGDSFQLEMLAEEPFLIREHARKFQWGQAQVSVWRLSDF
ncbi:MAG: putative 4-mercaptohistidine N1-methyltransferase [Blastochloris sp.]|nr:putative 4-mercaptohistidine N1-methyltransferase [Blastochloris sp.]